MTQSVRSNWLRGRVILVIALLAALGGFALGAAFAPSDCAEALQSGRLP